MTVPIVVDAVPVLSEPTVGVDGVGVGAAVDDGTALSDAVVEEVGSVDRFLAVGTSIMVVVVTAAGSTAVGSMVVLLLTVVELPKGVVVVDTVSVEVDAAIGTGSVMGDVNATIDDVVSIVEVTDAVGPIVAGLLEVLPSDRIPRCPAAPVLPADECTPRIVPNSVTT